MSNLIRELHTPKNLQACMQEDTTGFMSPKNLIPPLSSHDRFLKLIKSNNVDHTCELPRYFLGNKGPRGGNS